VSKIKKLRQNLLNLCRENCRRFFSRTRRRYNCDVVAWHCWLSPSRRRHDARQLLYTTGRDKHGRPPPIDQKWGEWDWLRLREMVCL